MTKRMLVIPLVLAACVQTTPATKGGPDSLSFVIDGTALEARQEYDWPQMIHPIDPATGKMTAVQSGTADTVIISGAPDDRDLAIKALGQFCGKEFDPMGWDTQVVHKDPASGDWWFDGFRCQG